MTILEENGNICVWLRGDNMGKYKMCCFTVNTTHACIIANNYIVNNLDNVKIIYINEKDENKKSDFGRPKSLLIY